MNKLKNAQRKALKEQTDVAAIESDLVEAMRIVRAAISSQENTPEDYSMAAIETFAAVALHVMKKCQPQLIRHAAQVIEIRARMDGVQVLEVAR